MRQLRCGTILAATLLVAACNSDNSEMPTTRVTVRGVTYALPNNQIEAASISRPAMIFVRLAPKDAKFHLVLDAFTPYLDNKLGEDVPTISRLNDNIYGKFEEVSSRGGKIICSLGAQPHFNCGLEIKDGAVKWGVLFDRAEIYNADEIRRQASSIIVSYR